MWKDQLILPRADSSCGKAFYTNRRMADGHRVALELWNRATGSVRDGYQLTVHRCNRCGGFHISQRRTQNQIPRPASVRQALPVGEEFR